MTDERGEQAKPDLLSISVSAVSWLFGIGFAALATAWVYFLVRTKDQLDTPGTLGQMGDFIGGSVNPVLSLMTLYALGLTVVMQAKQLRLSREELVATRAELARTAEAQEATGRLMSEQLAAAHAAALAQRSAAEAQQRSADALAAQADVSRVATVISALLSGVRDLEARALAIEDRMDKASALKQPIPPQAPKDLDDVRRLQKEAAAKVAALLAELETSVLKRRQGDSDR